MKHRAKRRAARKIGVTRAMLLLSVLALGCASEPAPEDDVGAETPPIEETRQALVPAHALAAFASTPPTIDGLQDDPVWFGPSELGVARVVSGSVTSPADGQAIWMSAWDAAALYVLVRVQDDSRVNDSALPWEDDSIEIYLDANRSRGATYDADDFQLVIGWNDASVREARGKSVTGVTFARTDAADGSVYEVKIPWSSLNGMAAVRNRTLGIDVHLNDDDNGGARDAKLTWHALVDSSWNDPRTFASLRLDAPAPVCPYIDWDTYRIEHAQVTPVIDGVEDASGAYGDPWQREAWRPIGETDAWYPNLSATWSMVSSETHLYVLIHVHDDVQRNDSQSPWEDDSVELYLDGNNQKTTYYQPDDMQLVFGFGDTSVVEPHGRPTTGITFVAVPMDSGRGYRVEARIPWALLGGAPTDGRTIGLDIHVNDDDDGGARDAKKSSYASRDSAWADPSVLGNGRVTVCTSP